MKLERANAIAIIADALMKGSSMIDVTVYCHDQDKTNYSVEVRCQQQSSREMTLLTSEFNQRSYGVTVLQVATYPDVIYRITDMTPKCVIMPVDGPTEDVPATDLLTAAKHILHLHMCEQEGMPSGMPQPQDWMTAVDALSDAIERFEKAIKLD